MEIHRAKPEEAATLTEIAFAAKRHWGYPEQWIQNWKNILTIRPEFIASHETYTACMDGQAVGFYGLAKGLDRMLLEHLWVLPNAMGQGVGRTLFSHAVQRAKALGIKAIEIESDPNAEKFYEKMGARRIKTKMTELEGQHRYLPVLLYECR
jgi:GNAT superfamily N-acetyltransferase